MPPSELLAKGREEVAGYGGQLMDGAVTDVVPDGSNGYRILLASGSRIRTRRLLVTTGLTDQLPDIPGLADRWARDVLHCPYCHGHEVLHQQLGVIGGTPDAVRYAQIVRQWTHDLVYFTPPGQLTAAERAELVARAVGIVEGTIESLLIGDDRLRGVRMGDGSTVPRDALFVPPRFVPRSRLLADLGCATDGDGWVTTDTPGRTSPERLGRRQRRRPPRPSWHRRRRRIRRRDPCCRCTSGAGPTRTNARPRIAINADLVDDDVRDAITAYHHGYTA